jgi:uncharacterized protein
MEDIQQQLGELRRRIARIDRKYAGGPPSPPAPAPPRDGADPAEPGDEPDGDRTSPAAQAHRHDAPSRYFIEELMSGEVVRTPLGEHFETEKLWERHRRHGSVDIGDLAELPEDLLDQLSSGAIPRSHPTRWAFLDTETTGLAGGTGTCAFLVGVGAIEPAGFRLRQFFMRDYGEEASLLARMKN